MRSQDTSTSIIECGPDQYLVNMFNGFKIQILLGPASTRWRSLTITV